MRSVAAQAAPLTLSVGKPSGCAAKVDMSKNCTYLLDARPIGANENFCLTPLPAPNSLNISR
jgi:hypothetical protein